jgi:hypothetical protein
MKVIGKTTFYDEIGKSIYPDTHCPEDYQAGKRILVKLVDNGQVMEQMYPVYVEELKDYCGVN